MYDQELVETTIAVDRIFLDPNNPRFTDLKTKIPDRRANEETVQRNTRVSIQKEGVEELVGSIIQNGFLPLDRIVVRELQPGNGNYVAVEGNRRLAALKTVTERIEGALVDDSDLDEEGQKQLLASITEIKCLVYTGSQTIDIAWILQGIRHISGIRDWSPAQRAELVAKEIDGSGLSPRQVGQKLGITTQAVNRLYNANRGLQHMLNDDDYQNRAKKEYFTLFEEANKRPAVRKWLGWNDTTKTYEETDNLHRFYQLISEDSENNGRRRIHDPRQVAHVDAMIKASREDLIDSVINESVTIDEAKGRLEESQTKHDWQSDLQRATKALENLPATALAEQPDVVTGLLQNLSATVSSLLAAVPAGRK